MDEAQTAQTEVDVIVAVTETRTEEECAPKLTFGPDGSINDPALLSIIQREKPLGPIDVLKLAQFFSKIPTGTFLAETLRTSALTTILTYPQLKRDLLAAFDLDSDDFKDENEDSPPHEGIAIGPFKFSHDDDGSSGPEDPQDESNLFIKTDILASTNLGSTDDVGLVIQSQVVNAEKTLYFVIGVSPDPAHLPLAGLKLHKSRRVYATHTASK